MIEVFKTNVQEVERSNRLLQRLLYHFPDNKINFDLEDCDKILRVEGENISPGKIMELLNEEGHFCEILDE
ncbi:MAG TPA: hypothetical protein VFI29_02445 [Hanamia sp.]|nr:hypothetical protein [Hanamia sp.]